MDRQDWQEYKVDEVKANCRNAIAMGPFGSRIKTDNFVKDGVPIIRGVNISQGRFYPNDFVFLTEEKADELKASNAFPGDLVFTHRGTLGQVGIIPEGLYPRYVVSQSQMKLSCDTSKVDPLFLFYYFSSIGKMELLKHTSGSGVPAIASPSTTLRNLKITIPPLPIQHKIATVLSAYDDLIEVNTRRIRILEQMAQAVYHEWFGKVDAQQSLPEGWEVVKFGDIADIQWGDTSVTKASYVENGYTAYSASGPDGKLEYFDFDRNGIVVSAIGANCGKTWFARGKWSCIKNTIRFWSISNRVTTEYLYFATSDESFWTKRGAAQPFISQGDVRESRIVCSSKDVMDRFTNFASATLEQIDILQRQNDDLQRTRDLLLPRLVSGEVEVL